MTNGAWVLLVFVVAVTAFALGMVLDPDIGKVMAS